jgi:mono/diheme cytochrome c family protein
MNPTRNSISNTRSLALLLMLGSAACGQAVIDNSGESATAAPHSLDSATTTSASSTGGFAKIRAARQAAIDSYLAAHAAEFTAFTQGALGSSGIPKLLFDQFPLIAPDIWGAPGTFLAPLGFSQNTFSSGAALPLGLASTVDPNTGLTVVNLSCGGCHMGKVIGPDGKVQPIVGAPNAQFNAFGSAVQATVADPRFDAAFANTPLAALATGTKTKVLQGRQLVDATLGAYTYNPARFPNAPDLHSLDKPGYLDAIGVALVSLIVPDVLAGNTSTVPLVLPPAPAQVDIPSVWRQNDRATAQWDGSIADRVYRNLAAEVGVMGSASLVSLSNAHDTANFAAGLPAAPYPFDVRMDQVADGLELYTKYCVSCHNSKTKRFTAAQTGTDINRTFDIQAEGRTRLIAALRTACTDATFCNVSDDQIVAQPDTVRGYIAGPLDGIWARAPYLHNGSVPTLYHLLVPSSRPATFARGSLRYDQAKVGFVWDDSALAEPNTHAFDTSEAGGANTGHSSLQFNGLDWSKNPKKLLALLEFLKTL